MTNEAVNLTNCDREPIHIPGSIQEHGCLLACDIHASVILRHSANAADILGLQGEINGRDLDDVLGEEVTHTLRNALATSGGESRAALLFDLDIRDTAFDVAIHRFHSTVIIEFEKSASRFTKPLDLTRALIGRLNKAVSADQLIRDAARLVRGLLGYDRVMVYQFGHDGSGKVVSEAKRSDLESFLGQYFPASDIPQQARVLYLRNIIRIVADSDGRRIPIEPVLDASGEPLDLSFAHLRSVSPIHCEYLRNMGVAASMSISIIIGGELWGLIACHHYSPRVLPMGLRVAAEVFGDFFSLHLNALLQRGKLETATQARRSLDRILKRASHQANVGDTLRASLADLGQLVPCDGLGLWIDEVWTPQGSAPPAEAVASIARFVGNVADGGRIWATHALSHRLASAEEYRDRASGILAVPLSQIPRDYLFFFRKEQVQTLDWAGNPEKSYDVGPLGDRLTPRKSFAIWKQTVHAQSQPWSEADREIAEAVRIALAEVVLRHGELLADERTKAEIRQRMLNEELNHRVKNILAIIKSLVGHPVQEGRNIEDYVASLQGRIQALAVAHDQVARGGGGGSLAELLDAELTPYRGPATTIMLDGPKVWLDARAYSVMALVLHELCTNAAKYGALSREGGKLSVAWSLVPEGGCKIEWRESGGPIVSPPKREGFGTVLIDRSIPYDLGGESRVDYLPTGVGACFFIPQKHILFVTVPGADQKMQAISAETRQSIDLSGTSLLLVEDQLLIALDVEAMLTERGLGDITISASVDDALRKLSAFMPDVAILDVNLGEGTSIPVAEALARRKIPFVFATGYGEKGMVPAAFSDIPVVRKPYDSESLIGAIASVTGRERPR
ncbi:HWE histidine kinase domain-containing protein [Microvirga zambiensis]|uniref:HWE histidine kinase domain-containing protein n=1 Tax=Microvirga zambiensis TaxID=1402137 RepID=UPI00191F4380